MYLRPIGNTAQWSDWQKDVPFEPPAAPEGFEWVDGDPPQEAQPYAAPDPLAALATMVRDLTPAERVDPTWGLFMMQCTFALQPPDQGPPDFVSFATLINGFQSANTNYMAIIAAAKQQFGV